MTTVFKQIGPYRILRQIGHGGMAVVFLATDTRCDRRVAASRPDALVTAAPMPDLDELDLVRKIRENERAAGMEPLPIIALSAHPREKRELAALAAGFSAFLEKPVRADLLASTVRSFVGRG